MPVSCKDRKNISAAAIESTRQDILDNITAEGRINKEHSVACSSELDNGDSGPDEAPILHESSEVQKNNSSSVFTCVENDESREGKNTTENPRKRRRYHKHNSNKKDTSPSNEKNGNMCYERKSSNISSCVRKRKLTLLEKVNKCRHCAKFFIKECVHISLAFLL
jgi:hypothetical protein